MTGDNLPYEIRRMIFDYLNLPTTKALRLVSKSWSTVGIEFLFPPSYHVRSFTKDILRLIDTSRSSNVSHQLAKSTREITFQVTDWLPQNLHKKLAYRYADPRYLKSTGNVSTVEEQGAYDELYAVLAEHEELKAEWFDEKRLLILKALESVPLVNSIKIVYKNPFQNEILRDLWERDANELVSLDPSKRSQIQDLLQTASEAGLSITHFEHHFLPLEILTSTTINSISPHLANIQTLRLTFKDLPSPTELTHLKTLLSQTPKLTTLTLNFPPKTHTPLTFLPPLPHLRTLTLTSLVLSTTTLTPFLVSHPRLRNLRIHNTTLSPEHPTWRSFLTSLKPHLCNLEKFELAGVLRQPSGMDGTQGTGTGTQGSKSGLWNFWPIYQDDWRDARVLETGIGGGWRKNVEDFCLRGGEWPECERNCGDDIFFLR